MYGHKVNPYLKENTFLTLKSDMRNLSETSVRKRDKKNNDIKKCNGSEHDALLIPAAALNEGEDQVCTPALKEQ